MPTWIRCEDPDTRHQFDLHEDDPRIADGRVKVVKDYPENSGLTAQARAPKYRVDTAGKPIPQTPPAVLPADDTTAGTSAKTKESN